MMYKLMIKILLLSYLLFSLVSCDFSPGGEQIIQTEIGTDCSIKEQETVSSVQDEQSLSVWVHVCGQVKKPGLYSLPEGSRIQDAVMVAGGFAKEADRNALNLAQIVADEEKIYVPSTEEQLNLQGGNEEKAGTVNLNTATKEELTTLPGIGDKRAEAIIKLRQEKGSFKSVEELLEVEGIKEGIFDQIKDFIRV